MKIKSLLIGMLACTALVGCSNEDDVLNGAEAIAKGEKAYVAVNLAMPSEYGSRAGSEYQVGSADEIKVNKAVFLFLDENLKGCANPFETTSDEVTLAANWSNASGTGEDKENTVLVIENGDKQVPAYVVAILNPTKEYTKATTLADLKAEHATYTGFTSKDFVMTNTVYRADNGKEVAATPISIANVKSSADEAMKSPVTIYVERVVGKVIVNGLADAASNWKTTETYTDGTDMGLKLKINGWNILQNKESYTVKNVDLAWTYNWWNAPTLHRSFWAMDYTDGGRTTYNVEEETVPTTGFRYVEETVNPEAGASKAETNPYLIVSGQFVGADGKTPVDLVEWRGEKYTKEGYLHFIASNPEVSQYWYAEDGKVKGQFSADLLEIVDNVDNDWQAQAVLKAAAKELQFVLPKYDAEGNALEEGYTEVELETVEAAVEAFGLVQYWNNGNTYYYVPITHEYAEDGNFYGVVRNHIYQVNISAISGFGTPVSTPGDPIDQPEDPEDDNSYMAAKVVILDWKVVVNDDVILGNGN